MKIAPQIEALEKLAELDAELLSLDSELAKEGEALGKKRGQLKQLETKIGGARGSLEEMERSRNELLTEARQMSSQMERSREKLARCRTEREVNAAQREVEELRKLYKDREGEVDKLSSFIEQARGDVEATVKERDSLAKELGSEEGDVTTKLASLEGAAAAKRKLRGALVEKVQPVRYRRYELIRKKLGHAIAYVGTDGTCNMCNIRIPPMMFQKMSRGEEFEQCPSCARILYYKPPEVASAENPSGAP